MIKNMPLLVLMGSLLDAFVKLTLIMILIGCKKIYSNKKFWISTFILGLYVFFSYMVTDSFIKLIILFLLTIVCLIYITHGQKINIFNMIITTFIVWLVIILVDIIYTSIFLNVLSLDMVYFRNNGYLNLFANSLVFITVTLIFCNSNIQRIIKKINHIKIKNSEYYYYIILITISVVMFSIIFYLCQFSYNPKVIQIVVLVMVIIYTIAILVTLNEFNQKNRIQSEYDILLKNLNEYENLLDLQRVTNHENKNQLLVIKGMVDKGESNTSEYINSIIDTQYKDNDAIIYKTNRIPSGGLRGLIYYKILTMKEKKINSNLDVDRSLNELDFDNIPIKTNQELCKIVGVFLDNAIQAVSELKKKEIDIYLKYENDELYIKVSNNYSGVIELDKIDNSGYTTKGKGHGYGLSLVKGIIRENDRFKNDREIHGKMFSQIVRLKINED